LVIDINIIFAALIKDGLAYHLLFSNKFHLFTPEYVFVEFDKHKEEILEKAERTNEEFFQLLGILKRRINIIPLEELKDYVKKAEELTPDPDDMAYFALALKLKCPIWSNDKRLKEQNVIRIYSTEELLNFNNGYHT